MASGSSRIRHERLNTLLIMLVPVSWALFFVSVLRPFFTVPPAGIGLLLALAFWSFESVRFSGSKKQGEAFPFYFTVLEMLLLIVSTAMLWMISKGLGWSDLAANPQIMLDWVPVFWIAATVWAWQFTALLSWDFHRADQDYAVFSVENYTRRLFRLIVLGIVLLSAGSEYRPLQFRTEPFNVIIQCIAGCMAVVSSLALLSRLNLKRRFPKWMQSPQQAVSQIPRRWAWWLMVFLGCVLVVSWLLPARFTPISLTEAFDRAMALLRPDSVGQAAGELDSAGLQRRWEDLRENRVLVVVSLLYGGTVATMLLVGLVNAVPLIIWLLVILTRNVPEWVGKAWNWLIRQWHLAVAWWYSRHAREDDESLWTDLRIDNERWDPARPVRPDRSWLRKSRRLSIRYLFYRFVLEAGKNDFRISPGETPREYCGKVISESDIQNAEDINTLGEAYEWARYSHSDPSAPMASSARQSLKKLLHRGPKRINKPDED